MIKYLFKRLLHGLVSLVAVVMIVMILVYSLMDRTLIFSTDPLYSKQLKSEQALMADSGKSRTNRDKNNKIKIKI